MRRATATTRSIMKIAPTCPPLTTENIWVRSAHAKRQLRKQRKLMQNPTGAKHVLMSVTPLKNISSFLFKQILQINKQSFS